MKIEVQEKGKNAVIELAGDLDYNSYAAFNDRVLDLLGKEFNRIVVDMGAVGHIDSMGLGTITKLWKTADEEGKSLVLASVPGNVSKLVKLINLDQRIKIFDDVKSALS